MTNFAAWVYEENWSCNLGFWKAHDYAAFKGQVEAYDGEGSLKDYELVWEQFVGFESDVAKATPTTSGAEKYYGTPDWTAYGGVGNFKIMNTDPIPLKLIYLLVPILDLSAAGANAAIWEDTSDWWSAIIIAQASMGVLSLVAWGFSWWLGDVVIGIWALFHIFAEIGTGVGIWFAHYHQSATETKPKFASMVYSYVAGALSLILNITANATVLAGGGTIPVLQLFAL